MDVMIDLETLDSSPTSAVLSIGACTFPEEHTFKANVSVASAMEHGTVSAATLEWWLRQSEAARAHLFDPAPVHLSVALQLLNTFWYTVGGKRAWGNGATFDNAIIRHAYERTGVKCPWQYYNDMCYRTIKNLNRDVKLDRSGTHHDSLSDAVSQARHASRILRLTSKENSDKMYDPPPSPSPGG